MNPQFQAWFSKGKISEALAGQNEYFVADHTYTNSHNFILAMSELFEWAKNAVDQKAALFAIESAVEKLFEANQCIAALRVFA